MHKHFFKRIIGFFGALCGVLLLSPVFIVVAAWLHFANKGAGAFFFQERIGKGEKPFKIIKFKSMTDEKDADGNLLPDAQRLTAAGRFVRSTSIDELPQLINVLKGDMSLVGTRPPTVDEFEQYDPHHKVRLAVKPGLTGMWQVSGRSDITDFEEVVRLDNQYIAEWNLRLDLKILVKTVGVVLGRRGSV